MVDNMKEWMEDISRVASEDLSVEIMFALRFKR